MSQTATATVEVLTAEVRVLMVGSRQITLSVFRQLDWVSPEKIQPMGRVRDKDDASDYVGVVGREISSGVLVQSGRRDGLHSSGDLKWFEQEAERKYREAVGEPPLSYFPIAEPYKKHDETAEQWAVRAPEAIREWQREKTAWEQTVTAYKQAVLRTAVEMQRRAEARYEQTHALFLEWASLPLIVLAGLR
jgi:hypothetical protein